MKQTRSAGLRIAQARLTHQAGKQRFYSGDDKLNPQRHQEQPHNTRDNVDAGLPWQAHHPWRHAENPPAA